MPVNTCAVTLTVFFAGLLACVAPASAQLYKWVDANGVVNYGDWPPDGVKLQAIGGGTVSSVSDRALVPVPARSADAASAPARASAPRNTPRRALSVPNPQASSSGSAVVDSAVPYYYEAPRAVAAVAAADRRPLETPVARPVLPIEGIPEMPPRPRR